MHNIMHKIFITLLLFVIAGCGGGGGFSGGGGSTGGGSSGGSGGGSNPGTTVRIGSGTGAAFTPGVLALGLNTLSAGGITSVSASLVDAAGAPLTTATSVSFTSPCVGSGLATLDPTVTTNSGVAISNYKAQGCSGNDIITATAVVGTATLTATATVNVMQAILGSIEFVSATPTNIALQGTGGVGRSETSTLVFRVRDTSGAPVNGQQVQFALNTTVGGLTLAPATATTIGGGLVQTAVTAGNVATVIRVTATVTIGAITLSTQSDQLVVSSGIPDQNSFSISAETLNPEAGDLDNVRDPILILVSDHFNNPVPDQTAVNFITEGGQIESSCNTEDGGCPVTWRSSLPRPADGRVTILATAVGEESFTDNNGNGRLDANAEAFIDSNRNGFYDAGEPFTDRDGDGLINPEHFADLGEAFLDNNENRVRDPAEEFVDFNDNLVFDGPDGKYNGLLCTPAARATGGICDAPTTLNTRRSIVLVTSGSSLFIDSGPTPASLAPGASSNISIFVQDENGQIPARGTTVNVSVTGLTTLGATSFVVP